MPNYRVSLSGLDFNDASILGGSINIVTSVDAPGAELVYDVFTVVVDFENGSCVLFSPADYDGILTEDLYLFGTADIITGDLTTTPYGTPINIYDGETLLAKFFVHDVVRVSKTHYKINAMSAIGFLENIQHMGGVYANATVSGVIAEIVNGAFTYTIDPDAAAQKVSGWLPIDTAKNNLHKLLFAMGVSVTKDADGDVVFTYLNSDNPSSIPEDRIYIGGNVDYNALATSVSVTEHSFYKRGGTQEEQIFSNVGGVAANHLFVTFQSPYYDVSSSDLTIHEAGDNYAIVSGVGTLTGKPYTHETNIYETANSSATGVVPNVVSSTEDTLVNSLNSPNVLARLAAYYGSRKTVSADIVLDSEKAGDAISFTDAFGDEDTGIIVQMDTLISSFAKARCKIVTDYTPTGQGNFYTNRELIDEDSTWTVPPGVTKIRIALIGGGGGAYGGYDGEEGAGGEDFYAIKDGAGTRTLGYRYGPQGAAEPTQPVKHGGQGGQPGKPGSTYVADLTVTPGEVITVAVGAGGTGGADHDTIGQDGTPTTATSTSIGSLSSDDGKASDAGYYDAFEGKAFATIGKTGYAGGDGGQTDTTDLFGWEGTSGLSGGGVDTYLGGAGGTGMITSGGYWRASGGAGGGAAYGANGGAGGNGTVDGEIVVGGDGGAGADAEAPSQAFYGCGGDGGNGGGAGGNSGGGYNGNGNVYPAQLVFGAKGAAGSGSIGGQGGDGCVIIYY